MRFHARGAQTTIVSDHATDHPDARLQTIPAADLPRFWQTENAFDAVWCADVLQRAPQPLAALRRLIALARPGAGIAVVIRTPDHRLCDGRVWQLSPAALTHLIILAGQDLRDATVVVHEQSLAVLWRRRDRAAAHGSAAEFAAPLASLAAFFPRDPLTAADDTLAWSRINADDFRPLPFAPGGHDAYATHVAGARLDALLADLARQRKRVAIYGAGAHTQRFAARFAAAAGTVVGVLDDDPQRAGAPLALWTVQPFDAWRTLRADALLISSDAYEAVLAARARERTAGVLAIRTLYDSGPPSAPLGLDP